MRRVPEVEVSELWADDSAANHPWKCPTHHQRLIIFQGTLRWFKEPPMFLRRWQNNVCLKLYFLRIPNIRCVFLQIELGVSCFLKIHDFCFLFFYFVFWFLNPILWLICVGYSTKICIPCIFSDICWLGKWAVCIP